MSEPQRYCPQCSAAVPAGATRCPQCGADLRVAPVKGSKRPLLIAVVVAVVAIGGLAWLLVGGSLTEGACEGGATAASIELSEHGIDEQASGGPAIVGRVRNCTGRDYQALSITFDLYSDAGAPVGVARDTLGHLPTGKYWAFQARIPEAGVAGYQLQNLSGQ